MMHAASLEEQRFTVEFEAFGCIHLDGADAETGFYAIRFLAFGEHPDLGRV